MIKSFMFIGLVFLLIGNLLNAQIDKISSKLENALIHTPVDETIKVWVYFTDKGGNHNLDLVKNNFTEKSKLRRAKVMGQDIVDKYDIPINSLYINNIKHFFSEHY